MAKYRMDNWIISGSGEMGKIYLSCNSNSSWTVLSTLKKEYFEKHYSIALVVSLWWFWSPMKLGMYKDHRNVLNIAQFRRRSRHSMTSASPGVMDAGLWICMDSFQWQSCWRSSHSLSWITLSRDHSLWHTVHICYFHWSSESLPCLYLAMVKTWLRSRLD